MTAGTSERFAMAWVRRVLRLMVGLFLYGFAISLMIRGQIGLAPWDVLSQGIARQLPISFGVATIVVSVAVLVLWIPLRERPGVGTLLNAVLVGLAADFGLAVIPVVDGIALKILLFAAGMLLLAFATGLYIGARLGRGPRDGLMTGVTRKTGLPIGLVRGGLEVSIVVIGYFLGGTVGIGTVVFAFGIGPLVHVAMRHLVPRAAYEN